MLERLKRMDCKSINVVIFVGSNPTQFKKIQLSLISNYISCLLPENLLLFETTLEAQVLSYINIEEVSIQINESKILEYYGK